MTDAKHEAPAEPCKSCNGTGRELGSRFNRCLECWTEAPAEGAGGLGSPSQWCDFLPEPSGPAEGAGEVEDEDLAGIKAAFQGESVINKNLALRRAYDRLRARSSAPEAREGEAIGLDEAQRKAVERAAMDAGAYSWRNARLAMVEGDKIIGYPAFSRADMAELARLNDTTAAPSADKLRIAVEALETISLPAHPMGAARVIAAKALSELQAKGAK